MQAQRSSRDTIFDTALELFAMYGYSVVSMRQIAKASGIVVASIYNHFPSKRDILDEIYRFYDSNMIRLSPNLEELMALIPCIPPREVLRRTTFVYPEEIQRRMGQATAIVISLVQHDKQADDLMNRHLVEQAGEYDIPLLNRMMELDLIEPIDAKRFSLLHANYHISSTVLYSTNHAIPDDVWLGGLDLLFELVKEKKKS